VIVVFLFIGFLLVISGVRGEEQTKLLLDTLKSDFSGQGNFFIWALAIGALYSIGYIKPLAKVSGLFVILVFVAIIVRRKDVNGDSFFVSFSKQIRSTENE
jgi:hypothetical protein